jgi:hypothetical protein
MRLSQTKLHSPTSPAPHLPTSLELPTYLLHVPSLSKSQSSLTQYAHTNAQTLNRMPSKTRDILTGNTHHITQLGKHSFSFHATIPYFRTITHYRLP